MSEVELNEAPAVGVYSVTLPTFEGPLDLLLHLCQKHELDILDIPIAFVTEKYLEYLAVMQLIDLDVASEYLVMAATLAHIKSKMLLPAPPPGQEDEVAGEEEDPREALIRRLLEYQKYKQAGEELAARGVAGRDVFLRGMTIENAVDTGLPPLAQVPLFSLVEAFQNVLSKSRVKLSHDIVHERVTLADRINELVDVLRVKRKITFEELFVDIETRFDLVITFLALLEMTRLRMTRLFQADFDSQIFIEFTAQVTGDDAEQGAAAIAEGVDGSGGAFAFASSDDDAAAEPEGGVTDEPDGPVRLDTDDPWPEETTINDTLAPDVAATDELDAHAPFRTEAPTQLDRDRSDTSVPEDFPEDTIPGFDTERPTAVDEEPLEVETIRSPTAPAPRPTDTAPRADEIVFESTDEVADRTDPDGVEAATIDGDEATGARHDRPEDERS